MNNEHHVKYTIEIRSNIISHWETMDACRADAAGWENHQNGITLTN